jgi:uncharacterized protein (UPF0332 family)
VTYAIDLLASARKLLTGISGAPPSSSDCNRAVSTAYYAIFDCVCSLCANHVVGQVKSGSEHSEAWLRIYRSLDHKQVSEAVQKISSLDDTSQSHALFISTLLKAALEARGEADYNRNKNFEPKDTLRIIGEAEMVIELLQNPENWGLDLDAFAKNLTVELFSRKRR